MSFLCYYRAFWGYHHHYPTTADRLFDSFDSYLQKHLNDEKRLLDRGPAAPPMQLSQVQYVNIYHIH